MDKIKKLDKIKEKGNKEIMPYLSKKSRDAILKNLESGWSKNIQIK